jgi:hypothetical protein
MKKTLILLAIGYQLLAISQVKAQSTSPRFGTVPNDDNTGRTLTYWYLTPTDQGPKDTFKFTPRGFQTFIQPTDSIKDTIVFYVYNTRSNVCDKMDFQFVGANGTSSKKIIFGTGFSQAITIPITSKQGYHISFIFDGNVWRETSVQAAN